MLNRLARHLRANLVAYIALFVALGGTSYAAFSLPTGSVGNRQLRNHSVTGVKLDPKSIAGSIRAWANIQGTAHGLGAIASNSPVRVTSSDQGEGVTWTRQRFSSRCVVSATPQVGSGGPGGTVTAQLMPDHRSVYLFGFAPDGSRRAQAAFVMILCP